MEHFWSIVLIWLGACGMLTSLWILIGPHDEPDPLNLEGRDPEDVP